MGKGGQSWAGVNGSLMRRGWMSFGMCAGLGEGVVGCGQVWVDMGKVGKSGQI